MSSTTWEAHRLRFPDLPPYSADLEPWVRYLDNRRPGESWDSLRARVSAEHDAADRGDVLTKAIYKTDGEGGGFEVELGDQERMDDCLARTQWEPDISDPCMPEVLDAFLAVSPLWVRVPMVHNPDTADFHWSRVRCFFAGFGYPLHERVATYFTGRYPQCPLTAQTRAEWLDDLTTAHKVCGWPVHLACLPWKHLVSAMASVEPDLHAQAEWEQGVSILHALKHARLADGTTRVVTTYAGVSTHMDSHTVTSSLGAQRQVGPHLIATLGIPKAGKKSGHPLGMSFRAVLNRLSLNDLPRRRNIAGLPGLLLAGPWSCLRADPAEKDGWVQHGCRVEGMWLARGGKVREETGDSADIMGWAWATEGSLDAEMVSARARLARILPDTYTVGFPSESFRQAFPNARHLDDLATACLFDAPVVASLVRSEVEHLRFEYPFIAFMPEHATIESSTNQGKSLAALTYARFLSPAIDRVMGGMDSNSAPNIREAADHVRRYGTVALDEFHLPMSKEHLFSRDSLQLLCTGGGVAVGRVQENSGSSVGLRHSLVCSAKALDFGPDLANRTMSFLLGDLTDSMRANGAALASVQDGSLALRARLQLIAWLEDTGLVDLLKGSLATSTVQGSRFGIHRMISRFLYQYRAEVSEAEAEKACDAAWVKMGRRFNAHCQEAETHGVMALLEDGRVTRIRLGTFFGHANNETVAEMHQFTVFGGPPADDEGRVWVPPVKLIEGALAQMGLGNQPLMQALPALTGRKASITPHQAGICLVRELRQAAPNGPYIVPGTDWMVWNRADGKVCLTR